MTTQPAEKTPVLKLTDLTAYQEGTIVSRQLLKRKSGSVTLFAFGKGEGLSEHTAPFDAFVYVVGGEAEITLAGETHRLQTGEAILLPADIPHAVYAPEDFKMLLTMVKAR